MSNPYSPPTPAATSDPLGRPQRVATSSFLRVHFIAFQLSLALVWSGLVFVNLGFARAIELASRRDLVMIIAVGMGVWLPHALLALYYGKIRRTGAVVTGIIAAVFFLIGMLLFDLLGKHLPNVLSVYVSQAPTYVPIVLYCLLSIGAVWIFATVRCPPGQITESDEDTFDSTHTRSHGSLYSGDQQAAQ